MKKVLFILLLSLFIFSSCKKNNEDNTNVDNTDNQGVLSNNEEEKVIIKYHIDEELMVKEYNLKDNNSLEVVEKEGYTFNGWKRSDGVSVNNFPNKKGTYDLYASLSKNSYELTLVYKKTMTKRTVQYLEEVDLDVITDLDQYEVFLGWSVSLDNIEILNKVVIKGDITLYAVIDTNDPISKAIKKIELPTETDEDLVLPNKIDDVNITWSSNLEAYLTNEGKVTRGEYSPIATLTATFSTIDDSRTVQYKIKIGKLTPKEVLDKVIKEYEFSAPLVNGTYNLKKNFSTPYNAISSSWVSSNQDLVDNNGKIVEYPDVVTEIEFSLTLSLKEETVNKTYKLTVEPISFEERLRLIEDDLKLSTIVMTNKIDLPTSFDNEITGVWESSDSSVIDTNGNVVLSKEVKEVNLTLKLRYKDNESSRVYKMRVYQNDMLKVIAANQMDVSKMTNLEVKNNKLVLKEDSLKGSYLSGDIEINNSKSIVPTWVATSSSNETIIFSFQLYDNGNWSGFISYSKRGWGLGLQNAMASQNDGIAMTDEDITKLVSGNKITKIRFKLEFERSSLNYEGPKLSMVTFMLEPETIVKNFNLNDIPSQVIYDVPKLYQRAVPSIGGIICSATSSTMLLKYKGEDFSSKDTYEHRYIAGLVKDYGNNIYGNWVYNCVGMSAYGYTAYVERLSGIEELVHHLIHIGPAALTVRGTMTSDVTSYTTSGHLLVIKGYTYQDGVLIFIANDPNVSTVECRYSSELIASTWKGVAYTIE